MLVESLNSQGQIERFENAVSLILTKKRRRFCVVAHFPALPDKLFSHMLIWMSAAGNSEFECLPREFVRIFPALDSNLPASALILWRRTVFRSWFYVAVWSRIALNNSFQVVMERQYFKDRRAKTIAKLMKVLCLWCVNCSWSIKGFFKMGIRTIQ
jgi:hypothetical protein